MPLVLLSIAWLAKIFSITHKQFILYAVLQISIFLGHWFERDGERTRKKKPNIKPKLDKLLYLSLAPLICLHLIKIDFELRWLAIIMFSNALKSFVRRRWTKTILSGALRVNRRRKTDTFVPMDKLTLLSYTLLYFRFFICISLENPFVNSNAQIRQYTDLALNRSFYRSRQMMRNHLTSVDHVKWSETIVFLWLTWKIIYSI